MTANANLEPTLQDLANKLDQLTLDVDARFDALSTTVDALSTTVDTLSTTVDTLSTTVERSNDKFDNYQKATQWVVQLAFTLIASATITVIVSTVFSK
jgi:outer membrane murein-binding lipoprotein Lpp